LDEGGKVISGIGDRKGEESAGVCLGAQLIANVLGAKVYANPQKEIGWFPVELNPPNVRNHPLSVLPAAYNRFPLARRHV